MPDGQHRVHRQHPGACPAHHRADLLPHFRLVAVHFAGRAEGLGLHEWALINAHQGIIVQLPALRAQGSFWGVVLPAAVKSDHLAHQHLFICALLIQVLRGILHGTGPPAALFFSTVRPHCSAAHRTAQKCKAYRNTNCCSHCHIHRLLKSKRQEHRPFRLPSPAAVLMHSVQRLLFLRESQFLLTFCSVKTPFCGALIVYRSSLCLSREASPAYHAARSAPSLRHAA